MVRKISVKQGEAEYQEFAVLTNGSPVNIESAICTFKVVDTLYNKECRYIKIE